jgi:flagellin FlaB
MQIKNSQDAFTGLEAAIVLIAFVVVAAVFSYVILGAGFYTSQKSQETVYKAAEQATTNIQMIGSVYGETESGGANITVIKFSIGLAPGSPSIDLRGMNIVFSTPDSTSLTILKHANATDSEASTSEFIAQKDGVGDNINALTGTDQVQISFKVPEVGASTVLNLEIRPAVGAPMPFSKTAPADIKNVNVLI